ncbi:hypothetical protein LCI18_002827 [Fusarium solani-melongenae]|uniref:Uncharacterized protein n=1 Tax=Fusarium solani subsp. cucurbitae TaxID=2747967 RepID=A0ACD3YSC6_FUSSC|nr:hypothetical protein LCI18_002827 [Fusarium solani-melongenae]
MKEVGSSTTRQTVTASSDAINFSDWHEGLGKPGIRNQEHPHGHVSLTWAMRRMGAGWYPSHPAHLSAGTAQTMERARRPRTGGAQEETKHAGPSSQSTPIIDNGAGDRLSAPGGTVNKSTGSGNHFPGAKFSGPVYFFEMDTRFNDIDTAAKGTCGWLLQHEMHTRWATCGRGLLWIKGKPGSGKSTLLRHVLNDVTLRLKTGEEALILSFFFHGRGADLQRTPLGLFRSLLYQLRDIPDALSDLIATFQQRCETIGKPGEKWQWHPRELQRFFELSLLEVLKTRAVWLFVDALDECGKENAVDLVEEFKFLFQRLPSGDLKQFHICFTCRHYPILYLDGVFEVCVEKENRKDISTFVQDKLSPFRKRTSSMIPDLIIERADGVFLWARLMVKQVLDLEREGIGLHQIKAKIDSVPLELGGLYCGLIRDMGPESLKLVQWICFATRPLSLDELRWAMLVDADCPHRSLYECQRAGDYPSDDDGMKRRVQILSCGLAEATSDTKIIQFIHQSVKDFFIEKGLSALDESTKTSFGVGIAHHRLSMTCIRYLAMEEIGWSASHTPYSLRSKFPFLHYATTSWVAHMKQSDARNVPQVDLLDYFAWPSNTLMERWMRIYRVLGRYSDDYPAERTSLVHVMSRYGVAGALRAILERAEQVGININAKDSHGRTPLSWAAENGHEAVMQMLLGQGARIEVADEGGRTPLSWAAENGHEAVVQLLLGRGARIEVADEGGRTPLSWAAENGHEAVMQLLLGRGACIEVADKRGQTPLSWAAENGHEAVVQMLLGQGACIEVADEGGRTSLSWAAENGHEAVVQLLLGRGACIEVADEGGRTPLSWAAENGHEAVVQLLLGRGACIEVADKRGQTPLSWAAENGHEAVVKLLLDTDKVDIDARDGYGRTPLLWATENGHETIVKLLLDTGKVNVNARYKYGGRTPFWLAAEQGYKRIVKLLLDTGKVDIDTRDECDGRTPLLWAAERGHEAIVKLLLDTGRVDVNARDKDGGRTPLLWAAEWGYETIVKLLLDTGKVDIGARDTAYGRTPLWWAAERGHKNIVKLLLDTSKVGVNARDEDGDRTSLWAAELLWAAEWGHEAIVKLLLDTGRVDVNARDKDGGRTPLLWAAEWGYETIVKLLLDTGKVDINARDDLDDRTPLLWAAEQGHEAIVKLLLDTGKVDINARDKHGARTPLLWATEHGHRTIVKLLLEAGADIESAGHHSQMPLSLAAENGHEAVVQLLLDWGAYTEVADKWDRTPLLWAAENGHEAVVQQLLDWGADIEGADKNGWTPLSWATMRGHEAVVRLLLDRGARTQVADKWDLTPLWWADAFEREAVVRLLQVYIAQPSSTISP